MKWHISSWHFTKLDGFFLFVIYMVEWSFHNKKIALSEKQKFYLFQSLNHVDVNLKPQFLIKSGYDIVPSPSTALTKGMTICTSFNLQMIDDYESYILSIDGLTIGLKTAYEETGLFFSGMGWIVKDLQTNGFQLWAPNKWHHFCLSFDKNSSHIRLIKVSGIQCGVVQSICSYWILYPNHSISIDSFRTCLITVVCILVWIQPF